MSVIQLKSDFRLQAKAMNIINDNGPCDILFLAARLEMRLAYPVAHIMHPLIYEGKIRLTPKGYTHIE